MTKEPLQQAHDALITSLAYVDATSAIAEVQGALKAIEQALAQQEQRINVPVAHELAKEQAKTDQSVTPEYLAWLESLYPARNGVGGNEAWNAGIAWFKAQQDQPSDVIRPTPIDAGEFMEKLEAEIKAQQEQPAQEPAETVTLVGIKDGIETVLGTVSTPPEMKAREIIRNYGWNPDDQDDFGEGETAMCIINDLLAWMRRQGAPKIELAAPTQPALTQEQAEKLAHRRATTYTHRNDLYATPYAFNPMHLMDFVRDIEAHCRGGANHG